QEREISVKGSIEVSNYPEVDKPFSFHFQSEMTLGRTNNKLFIAPFLNQSQTKNIFTQKERILPIDMIHKHAGKYNSRIQIPEGYQIEYIPKAFKMDNKYMLINYAIEQKDDEIIVNAEYQFKESLYEAMDYPALKECFNHMVHSFNDMIILSKL
ncbi:DUF3857 domain-containing protein, partial [Bacteroidales bacterium OttesenSCG-928-L03]|nr:DUF3857 domain-containing protein [Bacteroidales bacterium OttesenSCG-928-L03]